MIEETLYIKIFQPFAQYRNPFTFYYAQTYPLPPKSTIIGMLQNSVDDYYGQEYGVEKWWKIKVSIHGLFESVFWNYQQLIKGDVEVKKYVSESKLLLLNQSLPLYNADGIKSQRTPVYQQELFNGYLHLFIKGENEILRRIKDALVTPKKILSLGRSEDIVFIREVKFVNGESKQVKRSLWLDYPTYIKIKGFPIENQKYPVYSIPAKVIFRNNGVPVKNKAEITKNTERDVKFETVIYTGSDYVIYLKEPINVERYVIDDKVFKIPVDYGWL